MDARVLEAQQWVNTTYTGVVGYVRAPEDGRTGWPTMYSLTRALQHELGITTLSDAFGPTTLGRLEARGGVPLTEANHNIIKIIQSACYCKGYDPGGINGAFGLPTQLAVTSLMLNAGLGDRLGGVVRPKVMKALLTMDAYVLLAGGTDSVRSIQQWLNGRYISRKNFFVIPCDGIFSRDVQKALYLAIQFELGLTDDQATGVFGPSTQSGLSAHPLTQGDSGIFVNIFSAAMVFNRARLSGGGVYSEFTSTFGPPLAAAVRDFQSFSELPITGAGDYPTWCQLLVSTGDPDRPGTAADMISTITDARALALRAAGYRMVGRYLDEKPGGTLNKKIQPGELATIFANGLRVFPISQYYGGAVSYFTYSQGFQDAAGAHAAAVRYGFNTGTVIYFAVDYDATQAEIDSNIVPYFNGVVAGLADRGKKYIHGVYGSRNVCAEVTGRTYARWSFVSGMSTGFSGNMGFALPENWAFNQIQTRTVGTGTGLVEIDKDVYKAGTDTASASVNEPSAPADAFVAYVRQLYDLAVSYGGTRPPSQLVMEFLRSDIYANAPWRALIGDVDRAFINHVKSVGIIEIHEVRDPFYGIDLHVNHLAASCNGVYLTGQPAGTGTSRGDVAGWGGDWLTFYGEWRRDSASFASGLTYCNERLAKVDGNGTFKLRDLIEDADAYNMAMRVRAGANIADEVAATYLGAGYLTRFRRFFAGRFGGAFNAKAIAADMLRPNIDVIIEGGRTWLIQSTGGSPTIMPEFLPSESFDGFCQGLSDMLLARVGMEGARAKIWVARKGEE